MAKYPEQDIDKAVQESIRQVGAQRTLRDLKKGRIPRPETYTVLEGVVEVWPSGRADTALHTDLGRVVIQGGTRTDQTTPDLQISGGSRAGSPNDAPSHVRELNCEIENSKRLLDLCADWDDDGACPIDEQTWVSAISFLRRQAEFAWQRQQSTLPVPSILPGPDGSIDLHWDVPAFELLINVPHQGEGTATFYGDDRQTTVIRGSLDIDQVNRGVLGWLIQN